MPPKKLSLGSALTTRASNKNAHPGNIVKPKPRRTHAEMEQLRQNAAEEEREKANSQKAAAEALASMEDSLQVEVEQRKRKRTEIYKGTMQSMPAQVSREANMHSLEVAQSSGQALKVPDLSGSCSQEPHRTKRVKKTITVEISDEEGDKEHSPYELRDDSSDHESGDENEEDNEDINIGNKRKRKTKKKGVRHEDVDALRKTSVKSVVNNNNQKENVPQHTGKGADKMHGIRPGWNDGEDGEKMVKFGGIIDDNELDDVERDAIKARSDLMPRKAGMKKERKKLIKVEENPIFQPKTLKESRGGADKWTEQHLPPDAKAAYKDSVVPLAKKRAGNLDPWAMLSTKDVQEIVDKVYGVGKFKVHDDDVFVGLTNSRLHGWRNGFAQAALNTIELFIAKNELNTKELVTDQIELYLDNIVVCPDTDQRMYAYQWDEWDGENDTTNFGFLKNEFILRTFAIAHLANIPGLDSFEEDKPVGALLLAMQAVGRALELWRDGVDPIKQAKETNRKIKPFSTENYGDKKTESRKDGLVQQEINRVATFFLNTIKQKFDEKYWEELLDTARAFPEVKSKRHMTDRIGQNPKHRTK
ncbi:hypothetical protein JOM56_012679 [Amanita muscaria]